MIEDRSKRWWKRKEGKKKKHKGGREGEMKEGKEGEQRDNLPEVQTPHELVFSQLSQALSTVLITFLTATLIALAKELGTCKQLTLISQQVISLKEC